RSSRAARSQKGEPTLSQRGSLLSGTGELTPTDSLRNPAHSRSSCTSRDAGHQDRRSIDSAPTASYTTSVRSGDARTVRTRSTPWRAPSKVLKETAVPFYEMGDVRIRYEMVGSGFPLLVTPGGGLNSRVSNWPTAVFNAMEAFKNDFRCIT